MSAAQNIIMELGYANSLNYKTDVHMFEPETAHLFRSVSNLGVEGIYVFQSSPDTEHEILSDSPLVYVAEAESVEQAKVIHRSIWNLGRAPFLIIILPDEVRVYTGFDYEPGEAQERGLLETVPIDSTINLIRNTLEAFTAYSIDSGRIWSYPKYTDELSNQRKVDIRLLDNLRELDKALIKIGDLSSDVAHALIGKYVYIRYLWDRGILTEEWLDEQGIQKDLVFGRDATVEALAGLSAALESRFNGRIFPIEFELESALTDHHVALTASVFMGDAVISPTLTQLHLDFKAYDFKYIPIETLSAVYEQFIDERKPIGAVYTPEILADYLLSEINSTSSLVPNMKILDPACGSGIFLVLIYRRLIEQELLKTKSELLDPERLRTLLGNIYGVERELDACYVAEFSLILTLLHYIEPRELHLNTKFRFPDLHNTQIFHGDFFDTSLPIWKNKATFDCIIGNPPWVKASSKQIHAQEWIASHRETQPVGDLSVAEAFSWCVADLLSGSGVVGLVMPATSLVNLKSADYRKNFFAAFKVFRITNFANLRSVLFAKRATAKRTAEERATHPAATIVYRPREDKFDSYNIVHVAPLLANQVPGSHEGLWALTIYENEIQHISSIEAEKGDTTTWKLALWGTHLDAKLLERIKHLFPQTLEYWCRLWDWGNKYPQQGAELRSKEETNGEKVTYHPELSRLLTFNAKEFNKTPRHRFSLPTRALKRNNKHYVRRSGGLQTSYAPHIILSAGWDFFIYSDQDFIIPPRQMGISAPLEDKLKLKALASYLASSFVRYYLFFQVPEWGIFRYRESVVVSEVRKIPTPQFTEAQIQALAALQERVASQEMLRLTSEPQNVSSIQQDLQELIDTEVYNVLEIPSDIRLVVDDFVKVRLPLDNLRQSRNSIGRTPTTEELIFYATEIRDELNSYSMDIATYKVDIVVHDELIECIIDVTNNEEPHPINKDSIKQSGILSSQLYEELWKATGYQFSQWAYVQRGLRLFEETRIHLYKPARLINWTRTQAISDANSIIGQSLATEIDN